MNRNESNRNYDRSVHTNSFSLLHPPGGLIAWPDGSTSKIGECRHLKTLAFASNTERKGFVAWPENVQSALRA